MNKNSTTDPFALALQALVATLADERRAERLLALTGLDADALKQGLDDPSTLAQLLEFLEAHEPDLLAVASAIGVAPQELVQARMRLEA